MRYKYKYLVLAGTWNGQIGAADFGYSSFGVAGVFNTYSEALRCVSTLGYDYYSTGLNGWWDDRGIVKIVEIPI